MGYRDKLKQRQESFHRNTTYALTDEEYDRRHGKGEHANPAVAKHQKIIENSDKNYQILLEQDKALKTNKAAPVKYERYVAHQYQKYGLIDVISNDGDLLGSEAKEHIKKNYGDDAWKNYSYNVKQANELGGDAWAGVNLARSRILVDHYTNGNQSKDNTKNEQKQPVSDSFDQTPINGQTGKENATEEAIEYKKNELGLKKQEDIALPLNTTTPLKKKDKPKDYNGQAPLNPNYSLDPAPPINEQSEDERTPPSVPGVDGLRKEKNDAEYYQEAMSGNITPGQLLSASYSNMELDEYGEEVKLAPGIIANAAASNMNQNIIKEYNQLKDKQFDLEKERDRIKKQIKSAKEKEANRKVSKAGFATWRDHVVTPSFEEDEKRLEEIEKQLSNINDNPLLEIGEYVENKTNEERFIEKYNLDPNDRERYLKELQAGTTAQGIVSGLLEWAGVRPGKKFNIGPISFNDQQSDIYVAERLYQQEKLKAIGDQGLYNELFANSIEYDKDTGKLKIKSDELTEAYKYMQNDFENKIKDYVNDEKTQELLIKRLGLDKDNLDWEGNIYDKLLLETDLLTDDEAHEVELLLDAYDDLDNAIRPFYSLIAGREGGIELNIGNKTFDKELAESIYKEGGKELSENVNLGLMTNFTGILDNFSEYVTGSKTRNFTGAIIDANPQHFRNMPDKYDNTISQFGIDRSISDQELHALTVQVLLNDPKLEHLSNNERKKFIKELDESVNETYGLVMNSAYTVANLAGSIAGGGYSLGGKAANIAMVGKGKAFTNALKWSYKNNPKLYQKIKQSEWFKNIAHVNREASRVNIRQATGSNNLSKHVKGYGRNNVKPMNRAWTESEIRALPVKKRIKLWAQSMMGKADLSINNTRLTNMSDIVGKLPEGVFRMAAGSIAHDLMNGETDFSELKYNAGNMIQVEIMNQMIGRVVARPVQKALMRSKMFNKYGSYQGSYAKNIADRYAMLSYAAATIPSGTGQMAVEDFLNEHISYQRANYIQDAVIGPLFGANDIRGHMQMKRMGAEAANVYNSITEIQKWADSHEHFQIVDPNKGEMVPDDVETATQMTIIEEPKSVDEAPREKKVIVYTKEKGGLYGIMNKNRQKDKDGNDLPLTVDDIVNNHDLSDEQKQAIKDVYGNDAHNVRIEQFDDPNASISHYNAKEGIVYVNTNEKYKDIGYYDNDNITNILTHEGSHAKTTNKLNKDSQHYDEAFHNKMTAMLNDYRAIYDKKKEKLTAKLDSKDIASIEYALKNEDELIAMLYNQDPETQKLRNIFKKHLENNFVAQMFNAIGFDKGKIAELDKTIGDVIRRDDESIKDDTLIDEELSNPEILVTTLNDMTDSKVKLNEEEIASIENAIADMRAVDYIETNLPAVAQRLKTEGKEINAQNIKDYLNDIKLNKEEILIAQKSLAKLARIQPLEYDLYHGDAVPDTEIDFVAERLGYKNVDDMYTTSDILNLPFDKGVSLLSARLAVTMPSYNEAQRNKIAANVVRRAENYESVPNKILHYTKEGKTIIKDHPYEPVLYQPKDYGFKQTKDNMLSTIDEDIKNGIATPELQNVISNLETTTLAGRQLYDYDNNKSGNVTKLNPSKVPMLKLAKEGHFVMPKSELSGRTLISLPKGSYPTNYKQSLMFAEDAYNYVLQKQMDSDPNGNITSRYMGIVTGKAPVPFLDTVKDIFDGKAFEQSKLAQSTEFQKEPKKLEVAKEGYNEVKEYLYNRHLDSQGKLQRPFTLHAREEGLRNLEELHSSLTKHKNELVEFDKKNGDDLDPVQTKQRNNIKNKIKETEQALEDGVGAIAYQGMTNLVLMGLDPNGSMLKPKVEGDEVVPSKTAFKYGNHMLSSETNYIPRKEILKYIMPQIFDNKGEYKKEYLTANGLKVDSDGELYTEIAHLEHDFIKEYIDEDIAVKLLGSEERVDGSTLTVNKGLAKFISESTGFDETSAVKDKYYENTSNGVYLKKDAQFDIDFTDKDPVFGKIIRRLGNEVGMVSFDSATKGNGTYRYTEFYDADTGVTFLKDISGRVVDVKDDMQNKKEFIKEQKLKWYKDLFETGKVHDGLKKKLKLNNMSILKAAHNANGKRHSDAGAFGLDNSFGFFRDAPLFSEPFKGDKEGGKKIYDILRNDFAIATGVKYADKAIRLQTLKETLVKGIKEAPKENISPKENRMIKTYPKFIEWDYTGGKVSSDRLQEIVNMKDKTEVGFPDSGEDYVKYVEREYGKDAALYVAKTQKPITKQEAAFLRDNPEFVDEFLDNYISSDLGDGATMQEYAQKLLDQNENLIDRNQEMLFGLPSKEAGNININTNKFFDVKKTLDVLKEGLETLVDDGKIDPQVLELFNRDYNEEDSRKLLNRLIAYPDMVTKATQTASMTFLDQMIDRFTDRALKSKLDGEMGYLQPDLTAESDMDRLQEYMLRKNPGNANMIEKQFAGFKANMIENGVFTDDAVGVSLGKDIIEKYNLQPGDKVFLKVTPIDDEHSFVPVVVTGMTSGTNTMSMNTKYLTDVLGKDYDIDSAHIVVPPGSKYNNHISKENWDAVHEYLTGVGLNQGRLKKKTNEMQKLKHIRNGDQTEFNVQTGIPYENIHFNPFLPGYSQNIVKTVQGQGRALDQRNFYADDVVYGNQEVKDKSPEALALGSIFVQDPVDATTVTPYDREKALDQYTYNMYGSQYDAVREKMQKEAKEGQGINISRVNKAKKLGLESVVKSLELLKNKGTNKFELNLSDAQNSVLKNYGRQMILHDNSNVKNIIDDASKHAFNMQMATFMLKRTNSPFRLTELFGNLKKDPSLVKPTIKVIHKALQQAKVKGTIKGSTKAKGFDNPRIQYNFFRKNAVQFHVDENGFLYMQGFRPGENQTLDTPRFKWNKAVGEREYLTDVFGADGSYNSKLIPLNDWINVMAYNPNDRGKHNKDNEIDVKKDTAHGQGPFNFLSEINKKAFGRDNFHQYVADVIEAKVDGFIEKTNFPENFPIETKGLNPKQLRKIAKGILAANFNLYDITPKILSENMEKLFHKTSNPEKLKETIEANANLLTANYNLENVNAKIFNPTVIMKEAKALDIHGQNPDVAAFAIDADNAVGYTPDNKNPDGTIRHPEFPTHNLRNINGELSKVKSFSKFIDAGVLSKGLGKFFRDDEQILDENAWNDIATSIFNKLEIENIDQYKPGLLKELKRTHSKQSFNALMNLRANKDLDAIEAPRMAATELLHSLYNSVKEARKDYKRKMTSLRNWDITKSLRPDSIIKEGSKEKESYEAGAVIGYISDITYSDKELRDGTRELNNTKPYTLNDEIDDALMTNVGSQYLPRSIVEEILPMKVVSTMKDAIVMRGKELEGNDLNIKPIEQEALKTVSDDFLKAVDNLIRVESSVRDNFIEGSKIYVGENAYDFTNSKEFNEAVKRIAEQIMNSERNFDLTNDPDLSLQESNDLASSMANAVRGALKRKVIMQENGLLYKSMGKFIRSISEANPALSNLANRIEKQAQEELGQSLLEVKRKSRKIDLPYAKKMELAKEVIEDYKGILDKKKQLYEFWRKGNEGYAGLAFYRKYKYADGGEKEYKDYLPFLAFGIAKDLWNPKEQTVNKDDFNVALKPLYDLYLSKKKRKVIKKNETDIPLPEYDKGFNETDIPLPEYDKEFNESDIPLPEYHEEFNETDIPLPEYHEEFDESDIPLSKYDKEFDETDIPLPEYDREFNESDIPLPEYHEQFNEIDDIEPQTNKSEPSNLPKSEVKDDNLNEQAEINNFNDFADWMYEQAMIAMEHTNQSLKFYKFAQNHNVNGFEKDFWSLDKTEMHAKAKEAEQLVYNAINSVHNEFTREKEVMDLYEVESQSMEKNLAYMEKANKFTLDDVIEHFHPNKEFDISYADELSPLLKDAEYAMIDMAGVMNEQYMKRAGSKDPEVVRDAVLGTINAITGSDTIFRDYINPKDLRTIDKNDYSDAGQIVQMTAINNSGNLKVLKGVMLGTVMRDVTTEASTKISAEYEEGNYKAMQKEGRKKLEEVYTGEELEPEVTTTKKPFVAVWNTKEQRLMLVDADKIHGMTMGSMKSKHAEKKVKEYMEANGDAMMADHRLSIDKIKKTLQKQKAQQPGYLYKPWTSPDGKFELDPDVIPVSELTEAEHRTYEEYSYVKKNESKNRIQDELQKNMEEKLEPSMVESAWDSSKGNLNKFVATMIYLGGNKILKGAAQTVAGGVGAVTGVPGSMGLALNGIANITYGRYRPLLIAKQNVLGRVANAWKRPYLAMKEEAAGGKIEMTKDLKQKFKYWAGFKFLTRSLNEMSSAFNTPESDDPMIKKEVLGLEANTLTVDMMQNAGMVVSENGKSTKSGTRKQQLKELKRKYEAVEYLIELEKEHGLDFEGDLLENDAGENNKAKKLKRVAKSFIDDGIIKQEFVDDPLTGEQMQFFSIDGKKLTLTNMQKITGFDIMTSTWIDGNKLQNSELASLKNAYGYSEAQAKAILGEVYKEAGNIAPSILFNWAKKNMQKSIGAYDRTPKQREALNSIYNMFARFGRENYMDQTRYLAMRRDLYKGVKKLLGNNEKVFAEYGVNLGNAFLSNTDMEIRQAIGFGLTYAAITGGGAYYMMPVFAEIIGSIFNMNDEEKEELLSSKGDFVKATRDIMDLSRDFAINPVLTNVANASWALATPYIWAINDKDKDMHYNKYKGYMNRVKYFGRGIAPTTGFGAGVIKDVFLFNSVMLANDAMNEGKNTEKYMEENYYLQNLKMMEGFISPVPTVGMEYYQDQQKDKKSGSGKRNKASY